MATTSEILRTIRRRKSLGQTVPDRFVKNLFAAELDVEKARAFEGERLGIAKRVAAQSIESAKADIEFKKGSLAEAEKAREAEARAAGISGVAQIGFLGALGKSQLDRAAAEKLTAETEATKTGAFKTGATETGGAFGVKSTVGAPLPSGVVEAPTAIGVSEFAPLPTGVIEAPAAGGVPVAGAEIGALGTTGIVAGTIAAGVKGGEIGFDVGQEIGGLEGDISGNLVSQLIGGPIGVGVNVAKNLFDQTFGSWF